MARGGKCAVVLGGMTVALVVALAYHPVLVRRADARANVRAAIAAGPRVRPAAAAARAAARWAAPSSADAARSGPRAARAEPRGGVAVGAATSAPVAAAAAGAAAAPAPQRAGRTAAPAPATARASPTPPAAAAVGAAAAPCKAWCGSFWRTWCEAVAQCDVPYPAAVVQGMIEGGFSAPASMRALSATGVTRLPDVPRAIKWAIEQGGKERGLAEFALDREALIFNHTDFDGYAIRWGDKHRAASAADCADKCRAWLPVAPTWFVCNVFVFCAKPKCFAPAALPPGDMSGQCWLKHQDDPTRPQFNMKGRYTDAYRRTHATAPEWVEWTAGVVVPRGARVSADTPSARANWR
ncbi:hypothetical protein KFE25_008341 [Diacronema lutheri]|uniref:Apple domain-containing protein n=2 Tax=Diacronema lutheri TaxID=2081491 RepID=A0A8J5XPN3_DIALT|nr:hypothetical protein KFE25_008341 [Diacronema lutheri]